MKKYEKFCSFKLLIWRQKWTTGVRHGISLVVHRVSSGRPIVVLYWTKYAFPRQIRPGIPKLTTSSGHSNLLTVFSFVNCEEKGYHRVVSVGQLSLDCRSYCGRSCRMQGFVYRLLLWYWTSMLRSMTSIKTRYLLKIHLNYNFFLYTNIFCCFVLSIWWL